MGSLKPELEFRKRTFSGGQGSNAKKLIKDSYFHHANEKLAGLPERLQRAFMVLVIGVVIGLVEFAITSGLAEVVNRKFSFIQTLVDEGDSSGKQGLWLLIALPTMTLLAFVVVYLSPISAGSSLPEIKGYLNGAHIPGIFGRTTALVKAFGVILVIMCGYPVGREGPMVLIGCSIAHQMISMPIWYPFLARGLEKLDQKDLEADRVNKEKCLVVTIGGAAGIAAAFRSPVGGVLYMLEDMASYWTHETTVRAFGATMAATLTFSLLLNASHGINYEALVVFDPDPIKADWMVADLPWVFFEAILCGLISVLYSEGLYYFQRKRKMRKNFSKAMRIAEVFLCSLFICTIPLFIGHWVGGCQEDMGMHTYNITHGDRVETISRLVKFECEEGEYNQMSSIWLSGEEGVIKTLYSRDTGINEAFSVQTLMIFLPIYLSMAVICGGLAVPFGTFVPNLFMGAAFGRAYGVTLNDWLPSGKVSSPGTFALVGAASVLGGYTRMTMTVVVMIAEASGDISSTLPIMLGVQVARFTASVFAECYDEKMMELRFIPFLHDQPAADRIGDLATSVMYDVPNLQIAEKMSKLVELLGVDSGFDHFTAFPVVNENGTLEGLVQYTVLQKVLEHYATDKKFSDNPSAILIPLADLMQRSPYIVLSDFPLSRLFPIFRKLRVEHVVVLSHGGPPIGVIHRASLIEADIGAHQHTSHVKVMNKLSFKNTATRVKRQSLKFKEGGEAAMKIELTNMSRNGGNSNSNSLSTNRRRSESELPELGRSTSMYELGELYDDENSAKTNLKKMTRILTFGYFGDSKFSERKEEEKKFDLGVSISLAHGVSKATNLTPTRSRGASRGGSDEYLEEGVGGRGSFGGDGRRGSPSSKNSGSGLPGIDLDALVAMSEGGEGGTAL